MLLGEHHIHQLEVRGLRNVLWDGQGEQDGWGPCCSCDVPQGSSCPLHSVLPLSVDVHERAAQPEQKDVLTSGIFTSWVDGPRANGRRMLEVSVRCQGEKNVGLNMEVQAYSYWIAPKL